jgi:hypothetical protein
MATTTGAITTGVSTQNQAALDYRVSPETYTTLDTLIKTTKDFVMPDLVETYGNQGITGFLQLTGAVQSAGTSDQVDWYEVGRRHKVLAYTTCTVAGDSNDMTVTGSDVQDNVQPNDVLMEVDTGVRFIVASGGNTTGTSSTVTLLKLDGTTIADPADIDASTAGSFIKLGNMYQQGSEQPAGFNETDVHKRSNSFMIVKGRHEVSGSQATNIGWVNLGGGEYRWFMYAEQEARKRFEDQREMMLLFGQQHDGTPGTASGDILTDLPGSDGYFSQVETLGINVSGANANPIDSFAEIDDIILELDKVGAPAEYAMYLNRKQDLAIDDMLASGIATSVTAGLPGQFGAFQNNADMAVQLGFKSFTRGGYTFHKHDWKLLNDPTLLGASTVYQGAMVPLANVADARTGNKAPSLAMYYKEANGYSREMEHWVTGGGVLGYNNNGDAGRDQAVFHYRSECNLVVRAANQHVAIKG